MGSADWFAADLHGLNHEFEARLDVLRFLRGGIWRGFFSKYSESNLLHKKALYVSRKLQSARVRKEGDPDRAKMDEARTHLLRSQCNDAYWHGIFGGLYSPHLRTALWNELVRAETLLDSAQGKNVQGVRAERIDFDADGIEETYLTAQPGALLVKANDGATVPLIDFRPSGITLVNSLTRRLEAYHSRLANATQGDAAGVTSIHEQTKVKEPGLEGRLRYDRWARNCFRVLVFPHGKTREDYEWIRLGEERRDRRRLSIRAASLYAIDLNLCMMRRSILMARIRKDLRSACKRHFALNPARIAS